MDNAGAYIYGEGTGNIFFRYDSTGTGTLAYTNMRKIMDYLPKSLIVELTFTNGVAICNHNFGYITKDHYVSFCVPTANQFIITGCYNKNGNSTQINAINYSINDGTVSTLNGSFWVSFTALAHNL